MRSAILVLLSFAPVFAQTSQERGKQVIQEALAALGGARFMGMQDRVESGRAYSFYREELSGLSVATIYTRYRQGSSAPGEMLADERQSFGKDERSGAVLFAEGKGWQITFRGARPLPDDRVARWNDSMLHNIFYILRERMDEPGLIIESQGADVVDNFPVNVVDITDSENRKVRVYLHQSTHLPVRQQYYWRDPKTKDRNEEITIFSKYRDIETGLSVLREAVATQYPCGADRSGPGAVRDEESCAGYRGAGGRPPP